MKAKACIRSEEDYCPGNCDKRGRVSLYKLFDEPKYELKTYEIKKLIQILARREESENLDVPTFVDLLEVIRKTTLSDICLQLLEVRGLAEEIRMKKLIFLRLGH